MPTTRSAVKRGESSAEPSDIKSKTTKKAGKKTAKPEKEDHEEIDAEETKSEIPVKKAKAASRKKDAKEDEDEDVTAESIYEFTANNIKGEPVELETYKGHVCIVVNVASRCGHTKSNYEQFVKLHEDYGESKGLKILAFPCNQFGGQEPGDADKICKFVEGKNVKFDMFEKINVNGPKAHPLWKYLKSKIDGPNGKDIKWNFTKFIIDKEGQVVERFTPATKPQTLVSTLEKYW